jgi:DNA-damage-inducible protein J
MAQSLVNIRMDENVKKKMEKLCNELGITVSAAFNIFARKMIRENGIPFDVSADPFYSESNMIALDQSIKELEDGKTVTKTLQELEAMEND